MRLDTIFMALGFGWILYFLARLLNLWILKREDTNCRETLFDNLLGIVWVILCLFSLPVSIPMGFIDQAYSARRTKKHDHDMGLAHLKYYHKCDNCPGNEYAPAKSFGYDSENQRWTDESY